jgi:hypothetical protein
MVNFRMRISDKIREMSFDVPEEVLVKIDPEVKIAYKGGWIALKDMKGDMVLDVGDITIAQIAWLLKNRSVAYLQMEKTGKDGNKMVAVGIEG